MEHVAFSLNMDPLEVRVANFIGDGDAVFGIPGVKFSGENPLPKMIKDLKTSCAYDERKPFVDNFNKVRNALKCGTYQMTGFHELNFAIEQSMEKTGLVYCSDAVPESLSGFNFAVSGVHFW